MNNKIIVNLPNKNEIINRGIKISHSPKGYSWKKEQLGELADEKGVYIFHSANKFIYVGKTTTGKWGTFAERIRRHLQETSSQNSKTYQILSNLKSSIYVSLYTLDEIIKFIDFGDIKFSVKNNASERTVLLFEQGLIAYLNTIELNVK